MKKILIVTLLMVLVFGSILAITGVIGAEEPIVITEEDFEMDCMAAPAVAGILLEEAGIDNRYGTGKNGGNYISDVARHMGPETDFNGVDKCDIEAYKLEIAKFLISKGAEIGHLFEAVLESVVYEGTCSLFGTHIDDKITFTFSNNVFHDPNVEVKFKTAMRLWEGWGADDWTMNGNTATVTLKRLYSSPRDIIGDTVIDISGMVDALGNPVIIPSGGVEVDGIVTYPTVKQSGTFTSTRHLPGGWSYDIVIARDCDDSFISGTITLTDPNKNVVEAVIKDLRYDYAYWSGDIPNIAAVGTTTYLGENYYFMFLYAKRALWMGISTLDYQTAWDSGSVYSSGQRAYDIHSQNTYDFPIFW